MLYHERRAHKAGFTQVAGVDEAGRGPLAGPVVAASLILKTRRFTNRIDDSKKLTPKLRQHAYREIFEKADIGIGIMSEKAIDEMNIYRATARAMERAIEDLIAEPDLLLVDGLIRFRAPCALSNIIRGDSRSLSIASISQCS